MASSSDLLNRYVQLSGASTNPEAKAGFLAEYLEQHGPTIGPLIEDIQAKLDTPDLNERNLMAVVNQLIVAAIDHSPLIAWPELCADISANTDSHSQKLLIIMVGVHVKTRISDCTKEGRSILSIVPATPSALIAFEKMFSAERTMIIDMMTHGMDAHFEAYACHGLGNPRAMGSQRYPAHLQKLIKSMIYSQPLDAATAGIRRAFTGQSTPQSEEIYHRITANAARVWTSYSPDHIEKNVDIIEMPPLNQDFVERYGSFITQKIFDLAEANSRYGIGETGARRLAHVIQYLADHGVDWLRAFDHSTQNGSNIAALEQQQDVDRANALSGLLDAFEYTRSRSYESARYFCNFIMDTQPEDLVASALNSDENLKLRYEHSESKLLLDAMKKDSSVEQILEQALGL